MSHDDPDRLEQIVEGISQGCLQADCALLGGETAIMPDLYAPGDYDLAGFCVGVVERSAPDHGSAIDVDDQVLGIASSGLHSNGYSLVRKVVFDIAGLGLSDSDPGTRTDRAADAAGTHPDLRPGSRRILNHYKVKNVVHGIAHITGGGLQENLARGSCHRTSTCSWIANAWPVPPVFSWIQRLGEIEPGRKCAASSTWGSGWSWSSAPSMPTGSCSSCRMPVIRATTIGHVKAGSGRVLLAD